MTNEGSGVCLNCGTASAGKYCPACGQRMGLSRFTWHEVWHNATHALTHMDSGVGYSLKQLATRPGHTIREYLEGKRARHFNAFTMMLTFTAIVSILFVKYDIETQAAGIRLNSFEESNPTIVHKFFAIRSVFLILLCSLGDWLMFRTKRYSMPEMVIFNTYQFSFISVAQILWMPIYILAEHGEWASWAKGAFIVCAIAYMAWARLQFYQATKDKWVWVRVILLLVFIYLIVALTGRYIVRPALMNMHHG